MNIGDLNRSVVIKSPPSGQDAAGQPSGSWTTVATVWANVRVLNGTETLKASAPVSSVRASIRIRYRTDVTSAMRVEQGSTVYQILSVLPDVVGKVYVDLVCEVVS